jgi:hypothetical protein
MFRSFGLDNDEDDKKIKENEIIVLTHLKNIKYVSSDQFISFQKRINKKRKEKNKAEEEIEKEVEKEILEEVEKIKDKSLKTHYKIDNQKVIELENTFKSSKLKVYLNNPIILNNGNICLNNGTIYESKYFNILFNITLEDEIKSVIQLDNNDLIFAGEYYKTLYIYRLKDNKYSLFQKIKEDRKGYKIQKSCSGCEVYSKEFCLEWIKKLSNNRFMSISNYGIRLYSLNNNNQYSLVLMDTHLERIDKIYEINENSYIFCTNKHYGASLRREDYDYLLIEKVENIKKNELEKKINQLNEKERRYFKEKEKYDIKEFEEIISSLKLTNFSKKLFEYCTLRGSHEFSNFIILKEKYFIILVDNHLLLFNLSDNSLIKRYTFLKYGEKNLYINKYYNIRKWNSVNDNEFLLIEEDNITLFELNESNLKEKIIINLKIIGYYYLSNASYLLTDEDNRIYMKEEGEEKNNIFFY